MFPNVGTPALLVVVGSPPLDASMEAVEQCTCVNESLKDVRELHESLKAKREVLVSRKAAAELLFQMAAAGSALSPNLELLISRLSKLRKGLS